MAPFTFLEVLRSEVARMQTLHPERLGELARAHALILHGQVLPSADDPETGQVLSSDGEKRYTVNGVCDCQAGQHGKACKHVQAWKLYQYITKKVEAQPTPDVFGASTKNLPLPEAPASCNVFLAISGHKVQVTLRDGDEQRMLARLQTLLDKYPPPAPQAPSQPQGQGKEWCSKHQTTMHWNEGKEGRKGWHSHRTDDGWCKGR